MENAAFFIYLFASCIGVVCVALLLLLFKVRQVKAPWKNFLLLFVIITFLICLLYFMERFYTGNFETEGGWSIAERVADLTLACGQFLVWCWYLREKAGLSQRWLFVGTNVTLLTLFAVRLFIYLCVMNEHYYIVSDTARTAASGIYILFMTIETGLLIGYMVLVSRAIEDRETRKFLHGISLILLADYLGENFYVIALFGDSPLLGKGLYQAFDLVSLLFLMINLLVVIYVYRCEIRPEIPVAPEQAEEQMLAAQRQAMQEGGLSDRETEVALLLLEGASYDDIAERLTISKYTVKRHAHNIYQKLEVANKVELISKFR